jgi:hypothetical protein
VYDGGIFANTTEVKRILTKLAKYFVFKGIGKVESFVGCKIIENKTKNKVYIHQPKLLKNHKEKFVVLIESFKGLKHQHHHEPSLNAQTKVIYITITRPTN